MTKNISRRRFLGSAIASGTFSIVPRHVLGGKGYVAPNDKITLAHIGMGTQGFNELGTLLADPHIQIVAVCDPNRDSNDYVEWGKHSVRNRIRTYLGKPSWREGASGCPGGREIGREVVNSYYANQRGDAGFQACTTYSDFRELLETETDLDAVKIMTPDHLHATISIAAMDKGKHVLMHKPVANRLAEGRLVLQTARQTQRATHLLAHGSGTDNGRIARKIRDGVIGPLREIHNWSNRPVWPQYTKVPGDRPAVPKGFDWDLWLGPERSRPYHPNYTHAVFRGWYDFGGGSMADMGIYSLWPVFDALNLGVPASAEAWSTHTCSVVDQVSRRMVNEVSYPAACTLRFAFAAQQDMPDLDLFWYDGGMKPRLPTAIERHGTRLTDEGILFVGDDGLILARFQGQEPQWFANGRCEPLPLDDAALPDAGRTSGTAAWIDACRGGEPSPGSFLNAGPITDTVNLGTVALRAGRKILFDSETMRITNAPEAHRFLRREYREGWELEKPTT